MSGIRHHSCSNGSRKQVPICLTHFGGPLLQCGYAREPVGTLRRDCRKDNLLRISVSEPEGARRDESPPVGESSHETPCLSHWVAGKRETRHKHSRGIVIRLPRPCESI